MVKGALVFPKMNFKADPCCWDMRARKTASISVQCAYSRPEWLSNAGGMRQSPFAKQLAETPILFFVSCQAVFQNFDEEYYRYCKCAAS